MAQLVFVSDDELLATSDLIIIGTTLDDTRVPNVPYYQGGLATVRVDQVLRGQEVKTVVVQHAVAPIMPPGQVMSDHGGFSMQPQKQYLFFLSRAQCGYTIVGGGQGMRPPEDAKKFTTRMANLPVSITLAEPVGPFFFDRIVEVKISVANHSPLPVRIYANTPLVGYFYSPRSGDYVTFAMAPIPQVINPATSGIIHMGDNPPPVEIPAGQSQTIQVKLSSVQPESWRMLTPDTYFVTPVAVRARVFIFPVRPNVTDNRGGYNAASTWISSWVGFASPSKEKS